MSALSEGQVRYACMCHEHNNYNSMYRLLQKSELTIRLALFELKVHATNHDAIFNDCI